MIIEYAAVSHSERTRAKFGFVLSMCATPLVIVAGVLCWSHLAIEHFQRVSGTWVLYGRAQSAYYEKRCVLIESWVGAGLLFVLLFVVTFVALYRPAPAGDPADIRLPTGRVDNSYLGLNQLSANLSVTSRIEPEGARGKRPASLPGANPFVAATTPSLHLCCLPVSLLTACATAGS